MKQKLRNLSIHDRLNLEVSIALSFCIVIVLLTLYLMFGYRGAVDLAPQSDTPVTDTTNQVVKTDIGNTTKPQEQPVDKTAKPTTTPSDKTTTKPTNDNSKQSESTNNNKATEPSINSTSTKEDNATAKPDTEKKVSLSFSLEEAQKKYNFTFKIENASKLPVGLTLPSKDVLKYKISLYDGGVVKSGTIGTVDKTELSIKPKEIYELNLDINNIISDFNEGVYLFEVTPTIPIYNMVKASVMFSITKTQA